MQYIILLCFATIVACAHARVYYPPGYFKTHPHANKWSKIVRHARDVSTLPDKYWEKVWERNAGNGKVFGTLGSTDGSLFGRGGYKQDIFNDHRGHLQGQAYGSRVLGASGDSSMFGGKLDFANERARASLDVHKEIGRGSGMTVTGEGVWKLDKNTRLVTGGNLEKNFGHDKPEFGIQGKIEHDF